MNDRTQSQVNMKQRITGGVVLLALIVIIVPMVLDFRSDYDHIIRETNIPPQPENFKVEVYSFEKTKPIRVPLTPVEEVVQVESDTSEPQPPKSVEDTSSVDQAHAQDRIDELKSRGAVDKADSGIVLTSEAWVVQLASLSLESNAIKLRDRVRNAGMAAFVTSGQVNGKAMYRVLVGPKKLRSDADKLRLRLAKEVKLDGLVIKYQR